MYVFKLATFQHSNDHRMWERKLLRFTHLFTLSSRVVRDGTGPLPVPNESDVTGITWLAQSDVELCAGMEVEGPVVDIPNLTVRHLAGDCSVVQEGGLQSLTDCSEIYTKLRVSISDRSSGSIAFQREKEALDSSSPSSVTGTSSRPSRGSGSGSGLGEGEGSISDSDEQSSSLGDSTLSSAVTMLPRRSLASASCNLSISRSICAR